MSRKEMKLNFCISVLEHGIIMPTRSQGLLFVQKDVELGILSRDT